MESASRKQKKSNHIAPVIDNSFLSPKKIPIGICSCPMDPMSSKSLTNGTWPFPSESGTFPWESGRQY